MLAPGVLLVTPKAETYPKSYFAVPNRHNTMSGNREYAFKGRRKSYFCKVCQVACLNSSGLNQHFKDDKHKKMERAFYGQKYGQFSYSSLEDYISCLSRKEPLIGLQYIIQLYHQVDYMEAFKCSLCKVIGPLYFIIKHIESFKHRRTYMSTAYKHLFPLFPKKQMSYFERIWAVREHAVKVEMQEKSLSVNDSKSFTSRIGVKNDFLKYNLKRQETLERYKKMGNTCEKQKENILKYMETLVITSPDEAALIEELTEDLEAAVNVFSYHTKPRHEKYYKRGREQSPDHFKGRYSRSDHSRGKKRSIWYGKERKQSSSVCKEEVESVSDKHSVKEEGAESEGKPITIKDEPESPTASPHKEQLVTSDNLSEAPSATGDWSNLNTELVQEIRAKRIRKQSTDVAKWESLFANHRPETSRSQFSCGPKSTLNDAEVPLPVEKNVNTRRSSLDVLSTFTLFSQEEHEYGSDTFSSFQSPRIKPCQGLTWPGIKGSVFKGRGPQHKLKQIEDQEQEMPCTSNTVFNETKDKVMHTEPEQYDKYKWISHVTKSHQNSEAKSSSNQLTDVIANVEQAPKSSHILDTSSEYSEQKACGSRLLETKIDSQDADSNVLGNTLTTGSLHTVRRQLSPDVLQLFKGKATNHIVDMLKTLSPFYPALQDLDLEVFAESLSKTGAIKE
ncbi:uncharacterized protein ACNLHF_023742 isoform 2-T2 [Anomaloglossus baeobatrachus]|uniref:uncharacterized protein LOC142243231 isoform X2 n=1 Tax=Anomaloglossus baeobatrachus TaxID=238106 RepID=UPI003F4F433F